MKKRSRTLTSDLINSLREDASRKISRIAAELNRPVTTVFEKERSLRRRGIIKRYYSSLDFEKLGFPIRACFFIDADKKFQATAESLMRNSHVNNVQVLKGSKLFVEVVFSRIGPFLEFMKRLPAGYSVCYVIDEVATERAAIPEKLPVIL